MAAISADVKLTGETAATNYMPAVTGAVEDVKVSAANPVNKIGDGTTETTVKNLEISYAAPILVIDKAVVSEAIMITDAVTGSTPFELVVKSNSTVAKVVNAGKIVLRSEPTVEVKSVSEEIEMRAASTTVNTGAVKAVENNGQFTDETATIRIVGGAADLDITTLPKNVTTTGSSATLSVVASSTNAITYQWQKQAGSAWSNVASATTKDLAITKSVNGTTNYRCIVTATKAADKVTILQTPSASVQFKSDNTDPTPTPDPTPSVKKYTVTLPKVTGVTFSKGEKTEVEEGSDFSFTIKLDAAYSQSAPVVKLADGTEVKADAKGTYMVKNIKKDMTITVSGIKKNVPTAIEEIAEGSRIYTTKGLIHMELTQPLQVRIISMTGRVVYDAELSDSAQFAAPAGVYAITCQSGNQIATIKVSVR